MGNKETKKTELPAHNHPHTYPKPPPFLLIHSQNPIRHTNQTNKDKAPNLKINSTFTALLVNNLIHRNSTLIIPYKVIYSH